MFKRKADEALHNNREKKITPYSTYYHRRKGSCGVQKKIVNLIMLHKYLMNNLVIILDIKVVHKCSAYGNEIHPSRYADSPNAGHSYTCCVPR